MISVHLVSSIVSGMPTMEIVKSVGPLKTTSACAASRRVCSAMGANNWSWFQHSAPPKHERGEKFGICTFCGENGSRLKCCTCYIMVIYGKLLLISQVDMSMWKNRNIYIIHFTLIMCISHVLHNMYVIDCNCTCTCTCTCNTMYCM